MPLPHFDRSEEIFDRIQKEMRELRDRLDTLEGRFWEELDGHLEKRDGKEPEEKPEPAPTEAKNLQKA